MFPLEHNRILRIQDRMKRMRMTKNDCDIQLQLYSGFLLLLCRWAMWHILASEAGPAQSSPIMLPIVRKIPKEIPIGPLLKG